MKRFKNKKDKSIYKVYTQSIIEMFEKDKNYIEIKDDKPSNLYNIEENNEEPQENVD